MLANVAIGLSAPTDSKLEPVKVPEPFNEESVLFGQMASSRKLRGRIASCPTILQDVVDQCLFVVDVQCRRDDLIDQRSEVSVRPGRVRLGH